MLGPEMLVAREPVHRVLHRGGGELAGDGTAGLAARDEPGIRQHVEMFHYRRQRHGKRLGQVADRHAVVFLQARQQSPTGRVGQCGKNPVERLFLILYHIVKY